MLDRFIVDSQISRDENLIQLTGERKIVWWILRQDFPLIGTN